MAGIVLNKSISLMIFQYKMYEPVHVILLGFLYIWLTYINKTNYFTGNKIVTNFTINYLNYINCHSYKIIK